MITSRRTFSPEQAKDALKKNHNIRQISRGSVLSYAQDMLKGHWVFNAQGLVFDTAGRLRDGQHRLTAQVLAGVTVEYLVHDLCSEVECSNLDQGQTRSVAQIVAPNGSVDAPAYKRATMCVRILAVLAAKTSCRVSPKQVETLFERIGHNTITALLTGPKVHRIQAPIMAAFLLGYPLNPALIKSVATACALQDGSLPGLSPCQKATAGALIALVNSRGGSSGTDKALTRFYKSCRAVLALLEEETIINLRAQESSYEMLLSLRRRAGLQTDFKVAFG
jgi:hypothetical protein